MKNVTKTQRRERDYMHPMTAGEQARNLMRISLLAYVKSARRAKKSNSFETVCARFALVCFSKDKIVYPV